ncbi:Enoyl LovC [Cyphellophora attinorum]|uniref:Enoyl LovC n=1 Tax=Cyphellophora attinorum TaxID=1664694 RepID=A0A0N1H2T0_9EURO|nr:Enoyl LovC [Phialophora attinorum]KPI34504.1 Enoyl LovC [Phialophora attinorum]
MVSSSTKWLSSLVCFRRRLKPEVLDGEHSSHRFGTDHKEPVESSHSISTTLQQSARTSRESVAGKKRHDFSPQKEPAVVERTVSDDTLATVSVEKGSSLNQSLLVVAERQYKLVDDCAYPTLANEREVIIRPMAVGLNPIDWMSVDYNFCLPSFPWITGRECAGVVDHTGSEVTNVKVGDQVWTSTYYRDRRAGCFQQFVTVPEHTVLPMPANLNFDQASTLGVAGLTAAMTLWKWLEVTMPSVSCTAGSSPPAQATPSRSDEYLLIWGGATMTGQFATQIARLSGLKTICVASETSKSLCTSLGATHVITRDGKSPEMLLEEVQAIAADNITCAIDLVGAETASYCLRAVSTQRPVLFAPLAMMKNDMAIARNVRIETVEMKRFVLDEDNAFYAERLNSLIEAGAVKTPELDVMEGGLAVVEEGLARIKAGNRNGRKVVVRMS